MAAGEHEARRWHTVDPAFVVLAQQVFDRGHGADGKGFVLVAGHGALGRILIPAMYCLCRVWAMLACYTNSQDCYRLRV